MAGAALTAVAGARLVAGVIRGEPRERLVLWFAALLLPAALTFLASALVR